MGTSEIISTIAVVVAGIALATSILQIWINHRHSIYTLTPFLRINDHIFQTNLPKITLKNVGVGPAIVMEVTVTVGKKTFAYHNKEKDWFQQLKLPDSVVPVFWDSGSWVAPGEEGLLIECIEPATEEIKKKLKQLCFNVTYKSIHGKRELASSYSGKL